VLLNCEIFLSDSASHIFFRNMTEHVEQRLMSQQNRNRVSLALEALESLDSLMPLLSRMPNLTELDLHGNKLKELPKDLSGLRKLTTLNIKHNAFTHLGSVLNSLQTLPCLRELHADATTDDEEERIIIGLPSMAIFNGTNLLGDDDMVLPSSYTSAPPQKEAVASTPPIPTQKAPVAPGPPPPPPPAPPRNSQNNSAPAHTAPSKTSAGRSGPLQNDFNEAKSVFDELKGLRSTMSRSESARLSGVFDGHAQKTENDLDVNLSNTHDAFQRTLEITKAKQSLYDLCFQEAINFATTENPAFATALRKIRLQVQNSFAESGNLVNAMHSHYMDRLSESNAQIARAEKENSLLLQAAEALEQEMFQKNQEQARMMSELERGKQLSSKAEARKQEARGTGSARKHQQARQQPASTSGQYGQQQQQALRRHSKLGPSMQTLPSSFRTGPPPAPGATPGGGAFGPSLGPPRSAEKSTKIRILSLKQLKENFIDLIYESKEKFDKKCAKNHLPRETMEQHMYTFLNQRYGLKSLIIEHASAVIKGVNKYSELDNDVAVFGKILRNEIDEEFRFVQKQLKETVVELLRVYLKGKMPMKTDASINRVLESRLKGNVEEEEWVDIIKYMYNHEDGLSLMVLVKDSIRDLPVPQVKVKFRNNIPTRRRGSIVAMQNEQAALARSGRIPYRMFLKVLLDFQLKGHDKFLGRFRRMFRDVDADRNGVLSENEFRQFVLKIDPNKSLGEMDEIMNTIDPWSNSNITFSEAVGVLASDLVAMMTVRRE
jgi:cell division septum initiation protein DivIVA